MADFERLPKTYDIKITQGDYFYWPLSFAFDITNYTFDAHVKLSATTQFDFSIAKTDAQNGALALSLSKERTATMLGVYRYAFDMVNQAGDRRSLLIGNFEVIANE